MPDDTTPATAAGEGESSESTDDEAPPQTVEEVEALWKNRVSQKDKAHAAAEKVLRDEIAALKAKPASTEPNGDVAQQQAASQQRITELERQVEEERVKNLQMKYPVLAQQVGEDTSLFKMTDEATLARLNALGEQTPAAPAQPPPIMDPSTPKRTASTQQTHEPTSDELKGQLKKEEAAWKESVGY